MRCRDCKYAIECEGLTDKGNWVPYECNNRHSLFYKSLLNVTEDGVRMKDFTWTGCNSGERR